MVKVCTLPPGPASSIVTGVPTGTLVSVPDRLTVSLGPMVAGSGAGASTGASTVPCVVAGRPDGVVAVTS